MKTIETTVYTFDELDERAKNKAREWYCSCGLDGDWYKSTYDDAERIGLKITEFDLDRNRYAKGHFLTSARECADAILKEHGETCETYKTASAFLKERDAIVDNAERDENGDFADEYALDQQLDEVEAEFLKSILEDYSIILQSEADYLQSPEYIDETIRINEYTFTANGERFG